MAEYWDVYDKNGKRKNKTIKRGQILGPGEYHIIVESWIRVAPDRYIIQKRAKNKKTFPNLWYCSAGGSVHAGETPLEGIVREIEEELSLNIKPSDLKLKRIITECGGIFYIYLCDKIFSIEDVVIQEEEVQDVKIASVNEIFNLIDEGKFIKLDYYKKFFSGVGQFTLREEE